MQSPFTWFGGKGHLSTQILAEFPPDSEYSCYVEPFGGGASILFAKTPTCLEVYNDLDRLLVNFFQQLRTNSEEFIDKLKLVPYAREEHKEAKRVLHLPTLLAYLRSGKGVEAAVSFFILTRQSMSGDIKGGWSLGKTNNPVPSWLSAIDRLPECVNRFKQVQIENLGAIQCTEKYDGLKTMFYIDPPYMHSTRSETRYNIDMDSYQHKMLLKRLLNIKGFVLLSGYDNPSYNKALEEWGRVEIKTVSQATPNVGDNKGEGVMKENHARVEVMWLNPQLMEFKKQGILF